MDKKRINVTQSSMPSFEEYVEEIRILWENKWLSNGGIKHKEFEKELEAYLGVENVALFANGHLALEEAIAAFDLKGDVITTPFTHVSTTHSITKNGLTPIFCDVRESDLTIDPDEIRKKITKNTKAIVATHVYGNPCAVEEIDVIAKENNLKVIYDAAHAFGVKYKGESVLNYGDASMVSFHATKVFHTIEGGMVNFKSKDILERVNYIINFGYTSQESVDYIGTNARLNEFEAAMGLCNLRHIDEEIAKRKKNYDVIYEALNGVKGIKLYLSMNSVEHNYAYLPVVFDGYKETRDQIKAKLERNNIFPRKYFYPITTDLMCYKDRFDSFETPISKNASDKILCLPMYANLDIEDAKKICNIILA